MSQLLTAAEVARRLSLTTDRVYALVRADAIPHLRFGGRTIRFSAESIDQWLRQQERGNGDTQPGHEAGGRKGRHDA